MADARNESLTALHAALRLLAEHRVRLERLALLLEGATHG